MKKYGYYILCDDVYSGNLLEALRSDSKCGSSEVLASSMCEELTQSRRGFFIVTAFDQDCFLNSNECLLNVRIVVRFILECRYHRKCFGVSVMLDKPEEKHIL